MRRAQARLRAAAVALLAVLVARAAGTAELVAVEPGPELRLADGRAVRLAGVHLPGEDGMLRELVGGSVTLEPQEPPIDRWGRLRAQVRGADGGWVQELLVRQGAAVVEPAGDVDDTVLARLLALERAARAAAVGIWREGAVGPWPAGRVVAEPWTYGLVQGRVLSVARARGLVYLNYGRRWREDFTVRVEEAVARRLARKGLDVTALEGRNLLVRGTLFLENGPMIELVHPAQIEVLE